MRQRKNYNRIFKWKRLILQITLEVAGDPVLINLLPQAVIGINGKCVFAIGLEWICGNVNFGIMSPGFAAEEARREERLEMEAARLNITKKQARLRWGW